ncbi:MAG: biotin--[acetyl-CoA-carboxylase] ligase, partial [Candidatus Velamenicoccus archaeovorus]
IGLLAGLAMAVACREVAGAEVGCKWPNDLLRGEEKVGGILAESELEGGRIALVLLGVGVNLSAAPDVPGAGALGAVEPEGLLGRFLERFAEGYAPAEAGFGTRVVAAYRPVCSTLGRRVRATALDGTVIEGEAVDVDPTGALLVRTATRLEPIRSGQVEHLREG